MATFIYVRDRDTGYRYYVNEQSFDESVHVKVNAPKQHPDITGDRVILPPAQYVTDKAGAPATKAGTPAETEESA